MQCPGNLYPEANISTCAKYQYPENKYEKPAVIMLSIRN